MALAAHAEQMDVEIRCGFAVVGVGGQHLLVRERRGVQVVAELAIAGGHRVHVGRRDVDLVQQCLAGLLLVAFVVVFGDIAVLAPEQVHLRPVDMAAVLPGMLEQADASAAAGEHDQRPAPGRHRIGDGSDQPVSDGGDESRLVRVLLDDGVHTYCTLSMPSSASK